MEQMDIMLVDDSPEVAELTRIALETKKLSDKMTWFSDAEEAADFMFADNGYADRKDLHPRLILLDLHLPLMSGHEFLKMLKSNVATAHIPVVMFSSSDDQRDIVQSYQLGANGYLMKSADPREFIGTVADAGVYWVTRNKPVR
ncbi:response regulator [Herbaspirillum rhizosphaerae]|uniref:response regulator n=1 Tax=Herbaspirillum rhizosphaerae TaxID=346179 RepID=UPI000A88ECC5|nr:response regulator [Herbaspirillum rhizosphaerae]